MRVARSKFSMALVIVVPTALAFIGHFLVTVAGVVLGGPFDPSLIVLISGTIVVVTMALTAILLIERGTGHPASSVDPAPPKT